MSILNFSDNLFALVWNVSESLQISEMEITEKIELEHIRVKCFKGGSPVGSIKLEFYKKDQNTKLFESDPVDIEDISSNFLGLIRFDFERNNLQVGEYDIFANISGYTRNGNTDYFSMIYDFPIKIYPNAATHFDEHSIAVEVFGRP